MSVEPSKLQKIFVDFSLVAQRRAFGRVSGFLEVPLIPQIGDCISLELHGINMGISHHDGLSGVFKVESRAIVSGKGIDNVVFGLESFAVDTYEDAKILMLFLESAYGLFGEVYES